MTLDAFEELARTRRAVRKLKTDPLEDGMLERLLDIAHWAPSGYNLQPTHFVAVTDDAIKPALCEACFNQPQVKQAAATVVFVGDPEVVRHHLDRMIEQELALNENNEQYEPFLRKFIGMAFDTGPAGLGWISKATVAPVMGLWKVMPSIPAVHRRFWLTKQIMLAAQNFMLAAHAAGLATVPMEGFDERRVKRLLQIPAKMCVPVVIPVGHPEDTDLRKSRLPMDDLLHRNTWRPLD